jgi:hypothetical protein
MVMMLMMKIVLIEFDAKESPERTAYRFMLSIIARVFNGSI